MKTLEIFDVEHGACALLTCFAGLAPAWRLMIDCGHNAATGWRPGNHLRSLGVSQLDALVVTNYDEDHVSGYPNLLQQGIQIPFIIRNTSVSPEAIRFLKREDGVGAGIDALVRSLLGSYGPPTDAPRTPEGVYMRTFQNQYWTFDSENNLSTVLHLQVDGFHFLFPGDLECDGWQFLLATNHEFQDLMQHIDVLIASHHGRDNGICPQIFDLYGCRPKVVVISDDRKQYRTQETVNYYRSKCSTGATNFRMTGQTRWVLTTRDDKKLTFTFNGSGCSVT